MTKIYREALLPYSPQKMYALVNDIARYPEFLPWCSTTKIIESSETAISATITVKKMGVSKAFSTKNTLIENQEIHMKLINGPFKHLQGQWQFIDINGLGCKIILSLEFELLSGIVYLPFKKIFEPAADTLLQAFVKRAGEIYA